MKKLLKWLGIGMVVIIVLAVVFGGSGDKDEGTVSPTAQSTKTTPIPTRATKKPTVTPSLVQELEAAIERNKPAHEGTFEWEYHPPDYGLGARIDVVYFFDQILTDKLALKDFVRSFKSTAPELYGLDQSLDVLNVRYETTFVDTYGKESKGWMLKIQILRETADKINWDNMLMCDVPRVVEVFTPHLSLTAVWNEVCP